MVHTQLVSCSRPSRGGALTVFPVEAALRYRRTMVHTQLVSCSMDVSARSFQ